MDERQRREREDTYVLDAVQALSGLIGPAVEAVALHVGDNGLLFRFWTDGDTTEVAEDAEDALADLEALLLPHDLDYLEFEVLPGRPPPDAQLWVGRLLYLTKASAAPSGPRLMPEVDEHGIVIGFPFDVPQTPKDPQQLQRENDYVVLALQAMLGLTTPSVEIVVLHVHDNEMLFEFWVNSNVWAVEEDAQRVVARMRELVRHEPPRVSAEVILGLPPPASPGRYLYSAKLPSSDDAGDVSDSA